jgi:arylsulfatase A-like enzyme
MAQGGIPLRRRQSGLAQRIPTDLEQRAALLSLTVAVVSMIILGKGYVAWVYHDDLSDEVLQLYQGGLLVSCLQLLACFTEDVLVGLMCLFAGLVALWLGTRRAMSLAMHIAAVAALLFLLVNLKLLDVYHTFLDIDHFWMGGGFKPHQIIKNTLGWKVKTAGALVPVITLSAHWAGLHAFRGVWRAAASYACRPAPVFLLLLSLAVLGPPLRNWAGVGASDFSRNPHLLFLLSVVKQSFEPLEIATAYDDRNADRPVHVNGLLVNPPKNLIVIVGESINARHIEAYGCPLPTTPNLRRLAPISLTFENYYAPANYSLGSQMPIFHGLIGDPFVRSTFESHPGLTAPSVAAHLKQLGYKTYFFAAGGRSLWEDYIDSVQHDCTEGFDVSRDPANPFWSKVPRPDAFLSSDYTDASLFADARRALRENGVARFAMILWTYDTHYPYTAGPGPDNWEKDRFPPGLRQSAVWEAKYRTYLRAVWRLDRQIGDLYNDLVSLGIAEDTLVVFTGDHGEAFGEHGKFGHYQVPYEEQVRVPLVLINPRLAPLGTRNTAIGSHVDLWATITDVCSLPADPRWQGRSLFVPKMDGDRTFFRDGFLRSFGARVGRWKYFFSRRVQRKHFLFDLESDPGETKNLANDFPQRCDELNLAARGWLRKNRLKISP